MILLDSFVLKRTYKGGKRVTKPRLKGLFRANLEPSYARKKKNSPVADVTACVELKINRRIVVAIFSPFFKCTCHTVAVIEMLSSKF